MLIIIRALLENCFLPRMALNDFLWSSHSFVPYDVGFRHICTISLRSGQTILPRVRLPHMLFVDDALPQCMLEIFVWGPALWYTPCTFMNGFLYKIEILRIFQCTVNLIHRSSLSIQELSFTALDVAAKMRFNLPTFLLFTSALVSSTPVPHDPHISRFSKTFSEVTIFTPPSNYTDPQTLYARTVELADGVLLATWENYSPEPPLVYFPIYKSIDGGETWTHISNVTDQHNGWGLRYQPYLYLLPEPIANYEAGTIFLSGNSIPTNLSQTQIDLYASTDGGVTWEFVSSIASGGEAEPTNGLTPIWEPFLMLYEGSLVVYYSDQRDPAHGQKLVHQTSTDLVHWADPVDDVAYANYTARPGMTTVTQLPNGKYIMTYEYGGGPTASSSYQFPAYYRIADNPLEFNAAEGYPIIADGVQPTSSPYVTWTPVGGVNGTILVSTGSYSQIFVNKQLGAVDAWVEVATPESISYSRSLRVLKTDPELLLIAGGGVLPPATSNSVTVSVMSLSGI